MLWRATAVTTVLVLLGGLAAPDLAFAKKSKKPAVRFFGKVALRVIYDDNIIHYSDEDLDEFATLPTPGKYSIEQAEDWILRPRIEAGLTTSAITGKQLELLGRISAWRYVENGVKDNESYWVRLKHLGFGGDNFQLALYHAPEAYLRNFRDREAYLPQTTVPFDYTDFSYTSTTLSLAYWRRINRTIDGKFEVKRGWRFYNRPFMENDNWEWRAGGYVALRFVRPIKITGEYYYSSVEARARDTTEETAATSNDGDGSYERDSYKLTVGFYVPRNPARLARLNVSAQYQAYFFTSTKPPDEDPYHVGRKDEILRYEVTGSTRSIGKHVGLEIGYRRTTRESSAPWEDATGEGIDEDKNYKDNRFWIGVDYAF